MQQREQGNVKLFVGMHDGVCVLASTDGGRTWEQGVITPLAHAGSRLSVSRSEPDIAYLAAYESGMYRSDDGGTTWKQLPSYPSEYAHSVVVHPGDARLVYVGGEPSAIYRSRDGGETWEECAGFRAVPESSRWSFHNFDPRVHHVRDLRMAPNDPNSLYAGIEVGGVVRSGDGGENWEQLHGTDEDIHLINISGTRPERVYVATATGPYRSDDMGQTWRAITEGLLRRYTVHIAAAPDNADLVLVSVSSSPGRRDPQLYRSDNAGRSWAVVESVGSDGDMVVAMDWDPAHTGRVYAGSDRGTIYRSDDGGMSWNALPTKLPTIALGCLVVVPT